MNGVLICDYVRTPIGRFGGALSQVRADDLAAVTLRSLLERSPGLDPEELDEVVLGCANQAGEDNRNVARMALLLAGIPVGVPGVTVNRLCASGMDAVIAAARAIGTGDSELALAGGVESMSRAPFVMPKASAAFSRNAEIYDTTIGWRFANPLLERKFGIDSMPETAENVAAEYGVSRKDQDAFALHSQEKAATAVSNGRLAVEIAPVSIPQRKSDPVEVALDEHPRTTTLDKLSALPAPFRQGGSVTAGNSSGVNDGAAALLLASKKAAEQFDLVPIAKIIGAASAGVEPRVMGIGPVPAVEKLCDRLRLTLDDFDVIELNEAFASQSLAVLRALGVAENDQRVNPNGGAIALGHPLGMSGARITGTAAVELQKRGGIRALATMCVGVGQGVAIAMEAI
ncbi:MAG: 3-oxoadipyl-CoA thiolase [Albidovulum sp.]|nr:3-oxoadipyl-CoA thiolase [Albidovulum sp.]